MQRAEMVVPDKKRTTIILATVALGIITFLVYLPALKNGFVLWDDPEYVYENPFIRSLDLQFFQWLSTAVVVANWHPLTMLSHAVDYAFWGLNPAGHHLTAVIIHAINTVLVFLLAVNLMRGRSDALAAGLAAGLLFGLHPLHVESVVWVSERKDVLSAFFFLLSVLAYLEYASHSAARKRLYYAASLLAFLLALLSKPMAISLPVVLLIIDYYPLNRLGSLKGIKEAVVEKVPFYLLSVLSAAVTMWAQRKGGAIVSVEQFPFPSRVAGAFYSYIFYIYKAILPFKLYPLYPLEAAGLTAGVIAAIAVFAAITVYSVYSFKRRKIFPAVWLYYLITLFPVIGIVQVGRQSAADRYMYLPSVAPFILAGVGSVVLYRRLGKSVSYIAAAAGVVILIFLSALTVRQEMVWKDSVTLWTYEIGEFPDKIPTVYYNRALAYNRSARYNEALEDYTRAIKLDPLFKSAYINRGLLYNTLGRYDLAIEDYNRVLEMDPGHANTYINRGAAYLRAGNIEEGIKDFNRAIEADPKNPLAYYNLGTLYMKLGDREKGLYYLDRARSLGMK